MKEKAKLREKVKVEVNEKEEWRQTLKGNEKKVIKLTKKKNNVQMVNEIKMQRKIKRKANRSK